MHNLTAAQREFLRIASTRIGGAFLLGRRELSIGRELMKLGLVTIDLDDEPRRAVATDVGRKALLDGIGDN